MIRLCEKYLLVNDETGCCLEEEMLVDKLVYRKGNETITLENVQVENISNENVEVIVKNKDFVIIPIEDVIRWNVKSRLK